MTAATAIGAFAFRLNNTTGFDQTLTSEFVCDTRQTLEAALTPEVLALKYAPVFKAHRDEFYAPSPVERSVACASLGTGNGHVLQIPPTLLDLAQLPQSESRLDLPGGNGAAVENGVHCLGWREQPPRSTTRSRSWGRYRLNPVRRHRTSSFNTMSITLPTNGARRPRVERDTRATGRWFKSCWTPIRNRIA